VAVELYLHARQYDSLRPVTLTALLIGLAGGLCSGLLGIGGGVILVPLLTRFMGLPQKNAHGTSLAILVFTAIAAATAYAVGGTVDWRMALWLALGASVAAPLGARTASRWEPVRLRRVFGAVMALVGVRLFLIHLPQGSWLHQPGLLGDVYLIATGAVVGWLSGLLGVGGGVILVPILTLLFGTPQVAAQGVSLFMIVPTAFAGAYTHFKLGNVETRLVPPIALASVAAALAGAALAHHVPANALRIAFGALLVWVGLRMALRSRL
jgi:uncharacterized membrane protein YfcA